MGTRLAGNAPQRRGPDIGINVERDVTDCRIGCHRFLDLVSIQPPQPPLQLPIITLRSITEQCELHGIICLLFRVTEAKAGMTVAQIMATADIDAMKDPLNVGLGLQYASTAFLESAKFESMEAFRPRSAVIWSTNAAFRNEWKALLKNLYAGRLHACVWRGVMYRGNNVTVLQDVTTYIVAEFEPSTGKTYLALARYLQVMDTENPRLWSTVLQNTMVLKYSPYMMLLVCPETGHIHWQNGASCAAMGALASENAYPVQGSCEPYNLDYLGQLFMGNEHLRAEMERTVRAGNMYNTRLQIKGPELQGLLGVVSPVREVWHHLQCSLLKDPVTHKQVYVMSQNDVTETVLAERKVKQLQKQQLSLLKEMLPQQVIDMLLAEKAGGELPDRACHSSMTGLLHGFRSGSYSMSGNVSPHEPSRTSGSFSMLETYGYGYHRSHAPSRCQSMAAPTAAPAAATFGGEAAWAAQVQALATSAAACSPMYLQGAGVNSSEAGLASQAATSNHGSASSSIKSAALQQLLDAMASNNSLSDGGGADTGLGADDNAGSGTFADSAPASGAEHTAPTSSTQVPGLLLANSHDSGTATKVGACLAPQIPGLVEVTPGSMPRVKTGTSAEQAATASQAAAPQDSPSTKGMMHSPMPTRAGSASMPKFKVTSAASLRSQDSGKGAGCRPDKAGEDGSLLASPGIKADLGTELCSPSPGEASYGITGARWREERLKARSGRSSRSSRAILVGAGNAVDRQRASDDSSPPVKRQEVAAGRGEAASVTAAAGMTSGRVRPALKQHHSHESLCYRRLSFDDRGEYCMWSAADRRSWERKMEARDRARAAAVQALAGSAGPGDSNEQVVREAGLADPEGTRRQQQQQQQQQRQQGSTLQCAHDTADSRGGISNASQQGLMAGTVSASSFVNAGLSPPPMGPPSGRLSDATGLQLSRRDVMALATWHEEVTILFTDLKGFTSMSSTLHPAQIMLFLNHLYSMIDDLVTQFDVYKVETIGDCYMVCGGLFDRTGTLTLDAAGNVIESPLRVSSDVQGQQSADGVNCLGGDTHSDEDGSGNEGRPPVASGSASRRNVLGGYDPDHAAKVLAFAKAMVAAAATVMDPMGNRVQMRVGIHSGSVMSGVVGRKCPRFCLFGDTVNTASRMESTGEPGTIHVSQAYRDLLPLEPWQPREVFAKGKGALSTYYLRWELPLPADHKPAEEQMGA